MRAGDPYGLRVGAGTCMQSGFVSRAASKVGEPIASSQFERDRTTGVRDVKMLGEVSAFGDARMRIVKWN